ncbi:reverse transcriptase family protein [Paracoccus onubensis]|uniref:reverse transcriptase family protein n=1 Tax=Paracoccus onubensis TaxID=1675788 RepID=UPI002730BC17|nr:reverse transcriptase family protein [Paracoccus onubensis]MDP0930236.1 reverse transcriptase family protein [Paracoccus onubensis]
MDEAQFEQWKEHFAGRVVGRRGRALTRSYLMYIENLSKEGLPPIFEMAHLAQLIGVKYELLAEIAHEPHRFYRTFTIPKRSGGIRCIDTPRPILLNIQRWIFKEVLSKLNASENAHGFERNRSIITNARVHVGNAELLKIDIKNFFPSVAFEKVFEIFKRAGYPNNVCKALSRLTTKNGCLPQGAPTSPIISNLSCVEMDLLLNNSAEESGLVYTRYADDMSFSGDRIPDGMEESISSIASKFGFQLNGNKTCLSREGQRKIVTGISISSGELRLPRSYVRELRKQVHFVVNHGISAHSSVIQDNDPLLIDRLLGMVAFWLQVSPESRAAQRANDSLREYVRGFDAA